jgi:hypothetical protein
MPTECKPALFDFAPVETARLLPHSTVGAPPPTLARCSSVPPIASSSAMTRRLAACFRDSRNADFVEHSVQTLVTQGIVGIAPLLRGPDRP